MASWCRYIRHHSCALCNLLTPPFVVNNWSWTFELDEEALAASKWIFLKQVKYQQWGRHAYLHIPFHFLVENLRYSAPGPCWHEMAAWRRDTGVIRSSDMRIPDLRCPGPGAGSEYQLVIFELSTKYFMSKAPIRPLPTKQLFIFAHLTWH